MCCMSHVRCQVLDVRLQVSGVTCHMFCCLFVFLQNGWDRWRMVFYEGGLPHIVLRCEGIKPRLCSLFMTNEMLIGPLTSDKLVEITDIYWPNLWIFSQHAWFFYKSSTVNLDHKLVFYDNTSVGFCQRGSPETRRTCPMTRHQIIGVRDMTTCHSLGCIALCVNIDKLVQTPLDVGNWFH